MDATYIAFTSKIREKEEYLHYLKHHRFRRDELRREIPIIRACVEGLRKMLVWFRDSGRFVDIRSQGHVHRCSILIDALETKMRKFLGKIDGFEEFDSIGSDSYDDDINASESESD